MDERSFDITLPGDLARFVEERVRSGGFASAGEVVEAGLRLLADEKEQRKADLAEVRRKIAEGIAAAERGDVVDGEAFFDEWEREDKEAERQRKIA